jgi:hypothetical protein
MAVGSDKDAENNQNPDCRLGKAHQPGVTAFEAPFFLNGMPGNERLPAIPEKQARLHGHLKKSGLKHLPDINVSKSNQGK